MTEETRTALVLEDDLEMNEMYNTRLTSAGFETTSVDTVAAAIEHLDTHPAPTLIVSDLDLPDGSGREVLAHMNEDEKFASTVKIVVSAHAFERTHDVDGFAVDYVLIKPVTPRQLMLVVNELIEM